MGDPLRNSTWLALPSWAAGLAKLATVQSWPLRTAVLQRLLVAATHARRESGQLSAGLVVEGQFTVCASLKLVDFAEHPLALHSDLSLCSAGQHRAVAS